MSGRPGAAIGRRILRLEDPRLITGRGRYTDDVRLPGTLHVAFVRSPVAHGRLEAIEASEALALDGAKSIITSRELAEMEIGELPVTWVHPGQRGTSVPLLAVEKLLYVGQPVAAVVAETPYIAEDAAELVRLELERLPAVIDAEGALSDRAPLLHEEWGTNLLVEAVVGSGDVESAFSRADLVIGERFRVQRLAGTPIETRAVLASYEPTTGEVTLWSSTQVPHQTRTVICRVCGWREHLLRVIAPDVGGGFGPKDHPYAEDVILCALARRVGRPVKWVEDRREHFLATVHSRQQVWDVELAASKKGEIAGIRGELLYDIGGHSSNHGIGPARMAADMLPGPYAVPAVQITIRGAVTNKVPIGAYRGFGAPQATFVMERLVDILAARLELDRRQVRRLNMVKADQFPYATATGFSYDSGDYPGALDRALDLIDYEDFGKRKRKARREGRSLGLGIASFVQAAGLPPSRVLGEAGVDYGAYETVLIRMDPSGRALVSMPSSSQGQGHRTTMAQVCADRLGLDPERDVAVMQGDTATTPYGAASAVASRVASTAGAAVLVASDRLARRLIAIAAHRLEASEADIELSDGRAFVRGSPANGVGIADLARQAHLGHDLPDHLSPGLEERETFDPPGSTFPYGTHAAIVEVDPETGSLDVHRYVAINDCGTLLNPTIVEGQIIGGIAQGVGGALLEKLVYDKSGELLTASLMDYLVPTASEIPAVQIQHTETPAPGIPGGVKGAGEAGTLAPAAVIANALCDALPEGGGPVNALPLDPERIWKLAREAHGRPEAGTRGPRSPVATGLRGNPLPASRKSR